MEPNGRNTYAVSAAIALGMRPDLLDRATGTLDPYKLDRRGFQGVLGRPPTRHHLRLSDAGLLSFTGSMSRFQRSADIAISALA